MTGGALADLSASALAKRLAAGDVSAVEAAEAALDRIDEHDGRVNAFIYRDRKTTLAMAGASEARRRAGRPLGPLDGVPISVKDLTPVAGWPNRRGLHR